MATATVTTEATEFKAPTAVMLTDSAKVKVREIMATQDPLSGWFAYRRGRRRMLRFSVFDVV